MEWITLMIKLAPFAIDLIKSVEAAFPPKSGPDKHAVVANGLLSFADTLIPGAGDDPEMTSAINNLIVAIVAVMNLAVARKASSTQAVAGTPAQTASNAMAAVVGGRGLGAR